MPVNKQIGNLWFDTQEEIDRYDELMVANIELKEGTNSDDVNYTFICPRVKKELLPSYKSEKHLKGLEEYRNTKVNEKEAKFSYSYFHELPIFKYTTGTVVGYLLMRELPIRNFYGRATIMFFYLWGVRDNFNYRGLFKELRSNIVLHYHPEYM